MKIGLMDDIADSFGIFISDLHQLSIQYCTLAYIWHCQGYAVDEWNQMIFYVLKDKHVFQTEQAARDYYVGQVFKRLLEAAEHDTVGVGGN